MLPRSKKSAAQLDREISSKLRLEPPRIKRLGYIGGLPIYIVSGEKVRNEIDLDFTQGGNEAAYPGYVPPGEIWIDDAMHVLDRLATIFHEIVERNMVLFGGIDYDDAHDIALEREKIFRADLLRKRPSTTDLKLVRKGLVPYAHEAQPTGKRPGKASRTIKA